MHGRGRGQEGRGRGFGRGGVAAGKDLVYGVSRNHDVTLELLVVQLKVVVASATIITVFYPSCWFPSVLLVLLIFFPSFFLVADSSGRICDGCRLSCS